MQISRIHRAARNCIEPDMLSSFFLCFILIWIITVHASDTRNNIFRSAFPCFFHPPWIGDQLTSYDNSIGTSVLKYFFRLFRSHNPSHYRYRYLHFFFHKFCHFRIDFMRCICRRRHVDFCTIIYFHSAGNMNHIYLIFNPFYKFRNFINLHAAFYMLFSTYPHIQHIISSNRLPHPVYDHHREFYSIFKAPPILIFSFIKIRRKKLCRKPSVSEMKQYPIKPILFCVTCRLCKFICDFIHHFFIHSPHLCSIVSYEGYRPYGIITFFHNRKLTAVTQFKLRFRTALSDQ